MFYPLEYFSDYKIFMKKINFPKNPAELFN